MTMTTDHYHVWTLRGGTLHRTPRVYPTRQGAHFFLTQHGLKGKSRVFVCRDAKCRQVETCPSCGQVMPDAR